MGALDKQINGNHYQLKGMQSIVLIALLQLNFFQGSVFKYTLRHKDKAGKIDLDKAEHFCELAIELKPKHRPTEWYRQVITEFIATNEMSTEFGHFIHLIVMQDYEQCKTYINNLKAQNYGDRTKE